MDFKRSELATLERALTRELRACYDKRRKLQPSVCALMIVDTRNLLERIKGEAARWDEAQA